MSEDRVPWDQQVLVCHYCLVEPATTIDHIVPRAIIPKGRKLAQWLLIVNRVRACSTCNNRKAAFRADCTCQQCLMAWASYTEQLRLAYMPDTVSLEYITARTNKATG